MSKKQVIIIVVLILFVAAVVVAGLLTKNKSFKGFSLLQSSQKSGEKLAPAPTPAQNQFYVPEVPKDAKPTPPVSSAPTAPDSESTFGVYILNVSKNGFEPSTITVKHRDTVQIRMRAIDGDYDLTLPYMGLYKLVQQGQEGNITFDAGVAGTYKFECRDFCPPGGPIQGQIIVLP